MYLMTYNTEGERCRFHPGADPATQAEYQQLIRFATGYAQQATAVLLHAEGWVMTHGHTALTDPLGLRMTFDTVRNEVISRGLRSLHGLRGGVFCRNGPEETEVLDPYTMLDKMAYAMMQPIHHHLVADRAELARSPFYRTSTAMLGKTLIVQRPMCLEPTSCESDYPDEVELRYTAPEGWQGRDRARELAATLAARCKRHVALALAQRRELGIPRPVLAETLRVSPEHVPRGERCEDPIAFGEMRRLIVHHDAPPPHHPRRKTRKRKRTLFIPRVAGGTKADRKARLDAMAIFRAEHRKARLAFRAGDRGVAFPEGTFKMLRDHNVRIASLAN